MNFESVKNNVLNDWKKFKKVEKIELLIKKDSSKTNFLENLGKEYQNQVKNLSITSLNDKLPKDLTRNIFNSDPNLISYVVDEDLIHLSKIVKINIKENSEITIKEKISLNTEFRNALYNELLKEIKISTNDQMIDAVINSY